MKSAVAAMTSPDRRATAFGLFDMIFGLLWFAGSFLMGALYDASITALIAFSVIAQVLAIPLFLASSGVARGRAGEMHKGTS